MVVQSSLLKMGSIVEYCYLLLFQKIVNFFVHDFSNSHFESPFDVGLHRIRPGVGCSSPDFLNHDGSKNQIPK